MTKWEQSVESRVGFTRSQKQRMMLSPETRLGLRMTGLSCLFCCFDLFFLFSFSGRSVIYIHIQFLFNSQIIHNLLFSLPEVKEEKLAFLSVNISQDPLENFFGCQRQRGGTSDNPSVSEFYNNTQALRVVNSFC